jgi:hypothetical protein
VLTVAATWSRPTDSAPRYSSRARWVGFAQRHHRRRLADGHVVEDAERADHHAGKHEPGERERRVARLKQGCFLGAEAGQLGHAREQQRKENSRDEARTGPEHCCEALRPEPVRQ